MVPVEQRYPERGVGVPPSICNLSSISNRPASPTRWGRPRRIPRLHALLSTRPLAPESRDARVCSSSFVMIEPVGRGERFQFRNALRRSARRCHLTVGRPSCSPRRARTRTPGRARRRVPRRALPANRVSNSRLVCGNATMRGYPLALRLGADHARGRAARSGPARRPCISFSFSLEGRLGRCTAPRRAASSLVSIIKARNHDSLLKRGPRSYFSIKLGLSTYPVRYKMLLRTALARDRRGR